MMVFQHCGLLGDQCDQEIQHSDLAHQSYDELVLHDDNLARQGGDPEHQHDLVHQDGYALCLQNGYLDHQDCDDPDHQNDDPDLQDDGPDHQHDYVQRGCIGLAHQGDGLDHQGGDDLVHPRHEQEASRMDCEGEEQVECCHEDQDGDGGGMVGWS